MKDRIRIGILFAILFTVNTLLIVFIEQYEIRSGNIALSRILYSFFCVNFGYVIYYFIIKWQADFDSLKKIDLPTVLIATIPSILLSIAIYTKCHNAVWIPIVILWGIISLIQVVTFVVRLVKYNNTWSLARLFKRK